MTTPHIDSARIAEVAQPIVEDGRGRETVFDVIDAPYLGRTPRALGAKLDVLEHGSDMVLARHFTPLSAGLTATTVETV